MTSNHKLHTKFIKGLKAKYNLCETDLKDYIENTKRKEILSSPSVCICGHKIHNARYLMHKQGLKSNIDDIMIGNCCIKQFIDKEQRGKHCDICQIKHHNRLDNLCKKCRALCINCHHYTKAQNSQICYFCKITQLEKQKQEMQDSQSRTQHYNKSKQPCIDSKYFVNGIMKLDETQDYILDF
jgi:hypothetical protein